MYFVDTDMTDLWRESLDSDCQQFHQYQKDKQPLASNNWTQKEHDIWLSKIGPVLRHKHKCIRRNPINGIPTRLWQLDLQRQYSYRETTKKPAQICFHSKTPHTITKMNDNTNIDSTLTGSMQTRNTLRAKWMNFDLWCFQL